MKKLTKRDVDAVEIPSKGKDAFLWCGEVKGFGLRVKPGGTKTFVAGFRNHRGKYRRVKLGRYPSLTVEQAREQAKKVFASLSEGNDPAERKKKDKTFKTVEELCNLYREACANGLVLYKGRPLKASTIRRNEGRFRWHLIPQLGSEALQDVTKARVSKFHDDICLGKCKQTIKTSKKVRLVTGGNGAARKSVFLLSAVYRFGIKKGLIDFNPCLGVEVTPDGAKQRWLNFEEYERLGSALKEARALGVSSVVANYIWALALTACRRNEMVNLVPSSIDEKAGGIRTLMKGLGEKELVLRPCGAIPLNHLKSICGPDQEWVFPSKFVNSPLVNVDPQLKIITKHAGLEGVTCHTLRHSFATVAGELDYSELTIGGLLGHGRRTVTGKYVHKVEAALISAADEVSSEIAKRMGYEGPVVDTEPMRSLNTGLRARKVKLSPIDSLPGS